MTFTSTDDETFALFVELSIVLDVVLDSLNPVGSDIKVCDDETFAVFAELPIVVDVVLDSESSVTSVTKVFCDGSGLLTFEAVAVVLLHTRSNLTSQETSILTSFLLSTHKMYLSL